MLQIGTILRTLRTIFAAMIALSIAVSGMGSDYRRDPRDGD